ncbi:peroxiredoxin [Desertifilum sp. FACHB-1129]|uniref:thioredoxin-dependent peroxiredoxin n=2 Tax=Desertifilum tharense IPPAS B-1220 TaxID=1781255 RepID=A0A1E5QEE2_9CYAN|nr:MULTISPECIES: peroxiredoxin [Desertifilum]MDA0212865.1 peroxiredoxin [Cyanobacteria bacterium FC1]MBD2311432.1 peroxiredoxin [Desertifilum sp. FACHB-1129]MBD2321678.1 peroxiredoxin [Desertifilum sp. FACHB-866]MBD2331805.1 peroxiredoxin [Desertifilum sp. FACHB-868]OEJ73026.1 AhpC/TSA family protein [Desertifilum tharense IPPAS B-1220]
MSRRQFFSVLLAIALSFITVFNVTPPAFALGGKLPELNQSAPEFTLATNTGDGEISLSDYRGQWVVLYFYPKDFTSGCTLEARRFQQDLPEYLQRNTQILGVSADNVQSHAEFCDSEGLKFPLLTDSKGTVSKAYGSWIGFVSMRHTFIIDPQGILREIFTDVRPSVHSQEVLARLNELQQA